MDAGLKDYLRSLDLKHLAEYECLTLGRLAEAKRDYRDALANKRLEESILAFIDQVRKEIEIGNVVAFVPQANNKPARTRRAKTA